jgi:hypothetical protein
MYFIQIPILPFSFYKEALPIFYNSKYAPKPFLTSNLVPTTLNLHIFSPVTLN